MEQIVHPFCVMTKWKGIEGVIYWLTLTSRRCLGSDYFNHPYHYDRLSEMCKYPADLEDTVVQNCTQM